MMMERQSLECAALPGLCPRPEFPSETSFEQRKRTPSRAPRPPRAPAKSCPPVSRIFRDSDRFPATLQVVSFKAKTNRDALHSPHYKVESSKSYLEQCFNVCEKLGEGSFGEVYKASNRDDGKMYAIKKSRQPFRGRRDRDLKFAEVEKHERLPHHPNCVRFYKAWEERHKLYIQVELCLMSLAEYADLHGRIPEQRIWHMLIDLVKGLKHLHDNQLCHLDIKPANIFLGQDNFTCKIGDFGLCSNVDQGLSDAMEGDSRYLAPELMKRQFGKPADIFSLGISLLELACEVELPAGGECWHLLRNGQIPSELTKGLSPGLVSILSRMMHPDPTQRLTVDSILSDPCVVFAGYQHMCYKASYWLLTSCKHVLGKLLAIFLFLFSIFPVRRTAAVADSHTPEGDGLRQTSCSIHNDSFSEDEGDLLHCNTSCTSDDIADPNAKFNRSWIKNSPVRFPSDVYTGPPIPLNLDDSSFDEGSPEKKPSSSQPMSPLVSKSRSRAPNGVVPHGRLLTVERKKLAFND